MEFQFCLGAELKTKLRDSNNEYSGDMLSGDSKANKEFLTSTSQNKFVCQVNGVSAVTRVEIRGHL